MSTDEFRAFLLSLGLQPGEIIPGKDRWTRCPTVNKPHGKPGSYKLSADGEVGFARDYSVHPETVIWRRNRAPGEPVPRFDPAALERAHAEARRKQQAATQAARDFYNHRCKPLIGGHPYLLAHGLDMQGCYGLKVGAGLIRFGDDSEPFDVTGWLVVPAYKNGALLTVQIISEHGKKLFWRDAPVKGSSYTIERRGAAITVLCEGLATGLAIFAAMRTARVQVAFNAGNLKEVNPPLSGMLAIAADNDWETAERLGSNPGVKAAQEAAEAFSCGVAIPQGMNGSDWCDWREERLSARLVAHYKDPASRGRENDFRRAVDAELSAHISRAARLVNPQRKAAT